MNRFVIVCIAVFSCIAVTAAFAQDNVTHDFTVPESGGTGTFTLSEARESWVALHFLLKTECGFCMQLTNEYVSRATEMPDAFQIFLKPDEDEAIAQWKTSYLDKFLSETTSSAVPVLYRDRDARLAETFGIPGGYEFHDEVVHYPALIIIDPEGNEVFRYVGESNRDRLTFDQFTATIADLKAGGDGNSGLAVEEEVTPPPGHESHGQQMGGGTGH